MLTKNVNNSYIEKELISPYYNLKRYKSNLVVNVGEVLFFGGS